MTTAALVHLAVLANENGGGFNVQPGQQQAGGTVEWTHTHTHRVAVEHCAQHICRMCCWFDLCCVVCTWFPLPGPCSGHPVWPGGGCMPGSLLRGPPGRQAGLFFPGWHGPRKHEGLWWAQSQRSHMYFLIWGFYTLSICICIWVVLRPVCSLSPPAIFQMWQWDFLLEVLQ